MLMIAMCISANFCGAHEMDEHFKTAPLEKTCRADGADRLWYRNFFDYPAYASRPITAARPPARMAAAGGYGEQRQSRRFKTGPLVFGEPALTHSTVYFQWLHQARTSCRQTLLLRQNAFGTKEQQNMLLANCSHSQSLHNGQENVQEPHRHFPATGPRQPSCSTS